MAIPGLDDLAAHWLTMVVTCAAALVGAGVGTLLSEKARRKVLRDDLQAILLEEKSKAYEQEKGKRLATHEDIERVVEQLRRTEQTKAEIERESRRWELERDMYQRL